VFIFEFWQGRQVLFAILYVETGPWWHWYCGMLFDRVHLLTSRIVVIVYYRLSLMALTCWSNLLYNFTNSGNRLTAISTDSALLRPSSFDSQVRLSLKTGSVLILNVLSLVLMPLLMVYPFLSVSTLKSKLYVSTLKCMYSLSVITFKCHDIYQPCNTWGLSVITYNISTIWPLSR
jgi:hypothetical protein